MKAKILIVEHDSANIKLINEALEINKVNFISEIVHTQKEYKKALLNFKPDIILSHYTFPDFDGPAAFKIKKKMSPETPFIFVSESNGEEIAIEWIKNGVSDFVLKENISSLTAKMNRALKGFKVSKLDKIHQQAKALRIDELERNEAKFRAIFDNSIDGMILMVTGGDILAANPALCEILQRTEKEIIKAGEFAFADQTDPRFKLFLEELQCNGKAKGELTFFRKNGSRFPVELSSIVFKEASGQKNTSMIIRDISERILAEELQLSTSNSLQQALKERNKILDSSMDIICCVDEEGRFVSVNAAAENIWGYTPEELIGIKYIDFVVPEDTKNSLEIAAKIRTDKPVTMFENRYIHKNGKIVPMLWSSKWVEKDKKSYAVAKDVSDSKRMEKAFDTERQRFLDLFSQAPICMGILKGPDYVYEMVNPQYLKMIGKKDIIGKTLKEVLPELEAQGFFDLMDTVYKSGKPKSAVEALVQTDVNGDGILEDSYLNFLHQAHRNSEGIIDGIFFFAVDVTEQVLSRKKIEESGNRFRALIEKNEQMIILSTAEGKILYSSPSVIKFFGHALEEMPHKLSFDYIHPDDVSCFIEKRSTILEIPGASINHQQRVLNKNGNWIWCETTMTNMLHEPGVYALVKNLKDIDDKKIAEYNLKESEVKYRHLFESNPMPMWVIDSSTFKFLDVNEMATVQYGYSREEFLAMTALDIRPKEDKENFMHSFNSLDTNSNLYNKSIWRHQKKDGTSILVEIVAHEILFEGSLARLILSKDITDRRKAELKLEQQNIELVKTNSELDRFVYSVSHDLRSPLTSILGLLSFIEGESQEPDTLKHAEMIHKNINRLDQFIKNILSYSRNNRTGLEIEKISIQEKVRAIVHALQNLKEAKEIHFEIDIKEQQPFYTDRLRFKTILENLISNAVKYHKKDISGRYVKITGQSDHEKLQLTIVDNGIGIAPENHQKIFDMFFRLSGETDGSGIGLYIVKDTVEILQGSIEIQSGIETGTTFIITLKNLKP